MPWFPVPFVFTDPSNKKTDEYEYNSITWTGNIYSPAIKTIETSQGSSFWYYTDYGIDGWSTDEIYCISNKVSYSDLSAVNTPKEYVTGMSGTILSASMIPSKHRVSYSMNYRVKIKANPNSKNKVVRFCVCRKRKVTTKLTRREVLHGYQWFYYPIHNNSTISYTNMYLQEGKDAVITYESLDAVHFENLYLQGTSSSGNERYYGAIGEETVYVMNTIDLSKPGSYAYVTFQIGHCDIDGKDPALHYFGNGQQADCTCFISMELDKEDDIMFGEGCSMIYLGENLIDTGMINMGENAPTEIYVGENLVWSN